MAKCPAVLEAIGGEDGCKRLSSQFYERVGRDPVLRPLFPGKSLRCATEEFAAFLVQFLGGDEGQTQKRWWLSLRESHARFRIGPAERRAWLTHMQATLDEVAIDECARQALRQFFEVSSAYVTGGEPHRQSAVGSGDLAACWDEQLLLDNIIAALVAARDEEVIRLAPLFGSRPSVFASLLARMLRTGRISLVQFVVSAVQSDASLATHRFAGHTLLHESAAAGRLEVISSLLRLGVDPNIEDDGGHTPLYSVANECSSEWGSAIVRALVDAGAYVNACGGVTRATPLHMAARRGHFEIARILLDSGADINAHDRKGDTPLQRAVNCRKQAVVQLLRERGAA